MTTQTIVQADAVEFLRGQPKDSLDLVFGSPPYEEARLYLEGGVNMGISRKTDAWVAWMVEVFQAANVACKGLVAFVVAGQTRNYRWSAGPALLTAALHKAGMNLRNPPIFHRVGIPGSGGPDWLRSDYEWVVCTTKPGKLPWSDNTAMGHPPKWAPGGEISHRTLDGERVNSRKKSKHRTQYREGKGRAISVGVGDGRTEVQSYIPPEKANPGTIIKAVCGGGTMGARMCHENEAPFPEDLASFFVLSFCPPGGTVADCFSGSGTTAAMAKRHGRNFVGCDLRQSQVDLGLRRLANEQTLMFTGGNDE